MIKKSKIKAVLRYVINKCRFVQICTGIGTSKLILDKLEKLSFENSKLYSKLNLIQFDLGSGFVPETSWSIDTPQVIYILNDITINNRKSIIEFGSGISTLYIAKLISKLPRKVKFYSVDSDQNWIDIQRKTLQNWGLEDLVHFIYAPLNESSYIFKGDGNWYDEKILLNRIESSKFDLVIVDGPPGNGGYFRYPAFPFIKNYLDKDFTLLLDDTNRKFEKAIFFDWKKNIFSNVKFISGHNYSVLTTNMSFDITPNN